MPNIDLKNTGPGGLSHGAFRATSKSNPQLPPNNESDLGKDLGKSSNVTPIRHKIEYHLGEVVQFDIHDPEHAPKGIYCSGQVVKHISKSQVAIDGISISVDVPAKIREAMLPRIEGIFHVAYTDEVWSLQTTEDFIKMGIDNKATLKYPVIVKQQAAIAGIVEAVQVQKRKAKEIEKLNEKRMNVRSVMIIKRSEIPQAQRGKVGGLTVSVRENGQIGFSAKAAELFKGVTHCALDFSESDRVMSFRPADPKKPPKGYTEADLFVIATSGKNDARYINAAGLFKIDAVNYDYKVGTYSFDANIDEKTKTLSFTLPEKMGQKVKVPRKKKAAAAGAGTTNVTQMPAQNTPATVPVEEGELVEV